MPRHQPTPRDDPADELPPRLRCVEGQFIKPNGKPIFLHGPCYGSWGEDEAQDATQVVGMHANALRVNLRWWGKWGTDVRENPDSRDNDGFAFLKRANLQRYADQLTQASASGLWLIPFIDSNCGQSGNNTPEDIAYCDPYGTWGAPGHNFYTDPAMRRLYATIVWPAVAKYLRTLSRVAMLEIHPEPAHHRGEEYNPLVAQVQKDCIDSIRTVDTDTPILVGPREGYDIRLVEECLLALKDAYGGTLPEGLVFTGNLLNQYTVNPSRFDKGIKHLNELREKYGVCVFVQQVGRNSSEDPDLAFMRRAVSALREADIGYSWWQWKQNTSNPGNMGLNYKSPDGLGWVQKSNEMAVLAQDWAQG